MNTCDAITQRRLMSFTYDAARCSSARYRGSVPALDRPHSQPLNPHGATVGLNRIAVADLRPATTCEVPPGVSQGCSKVNQFVARKWPALFLNGRRFP
jgi:hypothetical protein